MKLSWRVFFNALNSARQDAGKVYEGRARYLRLFKAIRQIDKLYRKSDEESEEDVSLTHRQAAGLIVALCKQNGAMWIKVAQYLSCRPDILPAEYIEVFAELQTCSSTQYVRQFHEVEQTLLEVWGQQWDRPFEAFNIVPVASGSIAQVYHAVLPTSEKSLEVAVKVRVPGVEDLYEQDAIVLRALAKCLAPFYKELDIPQIVDEIIAATQAELDFNVEKQNILQYQQLKHKTTIASPKVLSDLSSSKVIVTEWIHARPLQVHLRENEVGAFEQKAVQDIATAMLEDIFIHGFYHGDPHPGNIMISDKPYLIDFGLVGTLTPEQRGHYFTLFLGMTGKLPSPDFKNLFSAAGFHAKDTELFVKVGDFIIELQKDESLDTGERFNSILNSLRKNKVILPQGFVGIIRVLLLMTGLYHRLDLSFEDTLDALST